MNETSSSNKNLLQFTVKLTPGQLKYLDDLAKVLEQFQTWFRLPVYMREGLKNDVADRRVSILRYLQELMARHYEELSKEPPPAKRAHAPKARPDAAAAEPMEQLGVRLSPAVLAYCDEIKPQLGVSATADVMREIVSQLQSWFDLPGFMAERRSSGHQGYPAPETTVTHISAISRSGAWKTRPFAKRSGFRRDAGATRHLSL